MNIACRLQNALSPHCCCCRYHRIGVPTYGLYLRASERGRFLDLLRSYPQQDIRVGWVTRWCISAQRAGWCTTQRLRAMS